MISKIIDVAVVVSDARKAAEWYRENLGFEVGGEPEGHWVVVHPPGGGEGTVIHLCEGPSLEPGNTGIGLATDNIEDAYKKMKDRGVDFTVEPKKEEWGTYAMFRDPDGNEFWLFEG
jgi:catechol 2,3-dioxygenase-like lactoylglutathione lyase family enzyme